MSSTSKNRLFDADKLKNMLDEKQKQHTLIDDKALATQIKSKVIDQDNVADEVARTIRHRMAQQREEKPLGVFCFAGPPGVGKTYFAKVLAEFFLGDKKLLHHFDMTQCNEPQSINGLVGIENFYQGASPGKLTQAIQNSNGNCIVLLDEFEKAHDEVHKIFLTAWNDGFITDRFTGDRVSTVDTVFIATTNAAYKQISSYTDNFKDDPDKLDNLCRTALRETGGFAPEVVSRIDRVFAFDFLSDLGLAHVAALEIEALSKRYHLKLVDNGIDLEILQDIVTEAKKLSEIGVRPIVRKLERDIADELIRAKSNNAIAIRLRKDQNKILVTIDQTR